MKKFYFFLLLACAPPVLAAVLIAQSQTYHSGQLFTAGGTLPGTCNVGEIYLKNTSTVGLYICTASNTWTVASTGSPSLTPLVITSSGLLEQYSASTAQDYSIYNYRSSSSDYERLTFGWTKNSNLFTIAPEAAGSGAVRAMRIYNPQNDIVFETSRNSNSGIILMNSGWQGNTVSSPRVQIGANSDDWFQFTSGTLKTLAVVDAFRSTGTSTATVIGASIEPTINFAAGTPGAGSYEALRIAPKETALPTGTNYLIRGMSGASGTTDVFSVLRSGAVTGLSYNGLTLTTTTGTFTLTNGKTFAVTNGLTLSGTDSTTMTFPSTSATIARTDAANTFTGNQTISEAVGGSGLTITGATQTTSQPALNITQTWNASGITFTGIKENITNTASASGSLLMDLQVGGTSEFKVDKAGSITVAPINTAGLTISPATGNGNAGLTLASPSTTIVNWTNSSGDMVFWNGSANVTSFVSTGGMRAQSTGLLGWSSGSSTSSFDTVLARGVAGQVDIGSTTSCGTAANCRDLRLRHLIGSGTAPTVASTSSNSCGTTSPTIAGTDSAGKVTVGATSGTSCTITFGTAFTNAPSCQSTNETTANLMRATTTTTTAIIAGTMVGGDVLSYVCVGY